MLALLLAQMTDAPRLSLSRSRHPFSPFPQLAKNTEELLLLENLHKVMDMYLWLGVNCGQAMFPSYHEVAQQRLVLADLISASIEALPAADPSRKARRHQAKRERR